jgi:uncharacterized RDD family membrane protein YckC
MPRRLAAIVYDLLLLIAILMLATLLLLPLTGGEAIRSGNHFFQLYLLLCSYIYFAWQWARGGQTLGMRAWRLRLRRSRDFAAPQWRDVSIRFIAAAFSWLLLGSGFLWALFDDDLQALHDRLSRTRLLVEDPGRFA